MAQYQHTDEARSRKLQPLCEAQAHPEQHRDLIVRVAGYSDYFFFGGLIHGLR
jgi:autonomous glycyl radical cofactor GrcA